MNDAALHAVLNSLLSLAALSLAVVCLALARSISREAHEAKETAERAAFKSDAAVGKAVQAERIVRRIANGDQSD